MIYRGLTVPALGLRATLRARQNKNVRRGPTPGYVNTPPIKPGDQCINHEAVLGFGGAAAFAAVCLIWPLIYLI